MIYFDERLEELVKAAIVEDQGEGDHSTLAVIPAGVRGRRYLKSSRLVYWRVLMFPGKYFKSVNPHLFSICIKMTAKPFVQEISRLP